MRYPLLCLIISVILFISTASTLSNAICNSKVYQQPDTSTRDLFNRIMFRGGSNVGHVESVASFEESLSTKDKLVVVDFSASWCMPCKMIAPVFEEMAGEFADSCTFLKVDVDETPEIAEKYQVMAMPTFIFIRNGEVVSRFSGASVEKMRETILSLTS